jgi:preprotein translocase SecE subunit
VKRIRQFIKESWSELKKVSWPNRMQVRNLTVLVFVISFVVGLYITVADTMFDQVIKFLAGLNA